MNKKIIENVLYFVEGCMIFAAGYGLVVITNLFFK